MKPIICLSLAVFAIVHSANGGEADSKASDAAKLLVSKQVLYYSKMITSNQERVKIRAQCN